MKRDLFCLKRERERNKVFLVSIKLFLTKQSKAKKIQHIDLHCFRSPKAIHGIACTVCFELDVQ